MKTKKLFIVGAGRSGTTFLWRILNKSPSVHLATEIHYFSSLYHDGFLKNLKKIKRKEKIIKIDSLVQCLKNGKYFGEYWKQNPHFLDQEIKKYFTNRSVNEKNIYDYLIEHDTRLKGKNRKILNYTGEKTPLNIFHLMKLYKWYPDATVLFIYRNPIDVLKSEVNKPVKPDFSLKRNNPLYPYVLVIFVFFEWLGSALIALFRNITNKDNFFIISFGQLVSNCQSSVRKITSELNIEYTDNLWKLKKMGSSYSVEKRVQYWHPSKFIIILFVLFLYPLYFLLNKASKNC